MKLNDLELNRYSFFARTTQLGNEDVLWEDFKPRLESAVKHIGNWKNTSEQKLVKPAARPGYFVPIATSKQGNSEFVLHEGFHRKLISGIFLDVYLLQERTGLATSIANLDKLSEAAQTIRAQIPPHRNTPNQFPAECLCYFVELEEAFGDTQKISATLLGTNDFTQIEFRHSFLAFAFPDRMASAVIIAKTFEGIEAKDQASRMFDVLLQEYFLSFAKIAHEIDAIAQVQNQDWRLTLSGYVDFLDNHQPETLSEIERANQTLSRYRAKLTRQSRTIEAHLHTIAVNVGNAERMLDNLLWRERKEELRPVLIEPLQHNVEQIKADLTYLQIAEGMAEIKAEEIANEANLKSASYGRRLAWIFGSLTLIGALQLFPAFINWADNFVKALILGLVVVIPIWIAFAEDIRDYFYASKYDDCEPTQSELPQGLQRESSKAVHDEFEVGSDTENAGQQK